VLAYFALPASIYFLSRSDQLDSIAAGLEILAGLILLAALIDLGFMPGTKGPNKYGPPPGKSPPASNEAGLPSG